MNINIKNTFFIYIIHYLNTIIEKTYKLLYNLYDKWFLIFIKEKIMKLIIVDDEKSSLFNILDTIMDDNKIE